MCSRRSSVPRHRHLAGANNACRLTVRVRSNIAENSRKQSPLIQASAEGQIPVVQPPASTLSPLLEISYSPDLSPDFFDDLFPSSPLPVSHAMSLSPIQKFSVSYYPQFLLFNAYSPAGHFPLFFHNVHQCWNICLTLFLLLMTVRVIVSIIESTCLFSIPIPFLISIDPLSFQSYELTQI